MVSLLSIGLLALAGVGAGLIGYLVGLASLVSYPALLAVGLSPVVANATNTLGMLGQAIGITMKSGRRFVTEQSVKTARIQAILAFVGGLLGGLLLLTTGETSFVSIVPWLILAASLLLLASPYVKRLKALGHVPPVILYGAIFLVCIYGGYFGAGAGTMVLAAMAVLSTIDFGFSVLLKSLLLGFSNVAAVCLFIIAGKVNWIAALALGIGCLIGGWLGPQIQKYIPDTILRYIVAVLGVGLATWLWLKK